MSLKAFHLFFVLICTVLSVSLGIWALRRYSASEDLGYLLMAVVWVVGGFVLLVYSRWFLRKLRNVSFI